MQTVKKLTNNSLVKKYFFISFIGALLGVSIYSFLTFSELQEAVVYKFKEGLFSALLGILIALVIYKSAQLLNNFIPWRSQTGNRLLAGLVLHFTLAYSLSYLFLIVYNYFFLKKDDFLNSFEAVFIKLAIVLLICVLIFEVIYFALYSYYSYASLQIETVKQKRKQIELQLGALKSQLSPHFLFNSLNTISSLVYKDEIKAEKFIRRLANMYDFTLKSYNQQLISVKEELDFVASYIYLIQTRFENKFLCKVNISEDLYETKIPPLTLQMLIENAVKHNQLSEENPLEVFITSDKKFISVENNITKKPNKVTSFKIGLKNINSRYLLLSNKAISVSYSEKFKVKIPVI